MATTLTQRVIERAEEALVRQQHLASFGLQLKQAHVPRVLHSVPCSNMDLKFRSSVPELHCKWVSAAET